MSNDKLSDNERLKSESELLRGTIKEDLTNDLTGGFLGDNFQLIRFHGMYQQDDRDIRSERTVQMLEPLHTVMLRVRLPGGIITPMQWAGIDEFASEHTQYGSIRITNRQALQLHGVLKKNIKPVHQLLHRLGLDSRATAGDVNRNVLCTSNPVESEIHQQAYDWAKKISEHLLPKTNAYAEVWLDGEKVKQPEEETILGNSYLPRKFKTAVVIPPQNDVDLHANDLNFVAVGDKGRLQGFNVLVGGGLAMTYGDKSTYPRLASELGFIPLESTLAVAEAVVSTQRDWGNRKNRRNAKTKYTIDRVGVDAFKAEVELRAGMTFQEIKTYRFTGRGDRIGWVSGNDNKYHLTLFIPSGRLIDSLGKPIKSGLAAIANIHKGDFRLTPNQNIIVAGVPEKDQQLIDSLARQYGLIDDSVSSQRKQSMACVSYPTCPLAMAEAERVLPGIIDRLDAILVRNQIPTESFIFRVTGCPNGCGRAMLAEVGLVGRALDRYDLYVGGNKEGTRIPRLYKENWHLNDIISELDSLISSWAVNRNDNEDFGDFTIRNGIIRPVLNSTDDFYI
ncbi:assimilatory sulfite reductase (NADPH) hemoprotein subunit [Citrobacter sp. wls619]|uniref:assimilatory sulfite reductase (NADPH) hemoprotein subunit n=1 Tax=Citrobacter sp. wls619 TaxID=2576432 RepID=UPI0010C9D3D1|nr:assimilatory sulfite reductase (NADPH) hemoprotein subunit [Citrobacter sp. wls619]TKV10783.1 assimilatory sulfite reductase (NADPH) hemoprotein subunit [Citrobacter sp. wls619]